ncbi:MAG: alginate export family protein [Bacteroidetes bacterium]|nr:alginate export family protein [Bacteroidota bacterium]
MRQLYYFFFVGSLLLFTIDSFAQFSLSGEYRPRSEYRDGYTRLPDSSTTPAYFVSQRIRLSSTYSNRNMTYRLTLQEVRVWGDEKTKSKTATLNVYEAWMDWKLADSLKLKIGRQELVYDNERIFGNNNWTQIGQAHDAIVLKARYRGWKADVGMAFNQSKENTFGTSYNNEESPIEGNYKSLNFIWIEKSIHSFRFSVFEVADGFQKSQTTATTYLRSTSGANLYYTRKKVTLAARAYYQLGQTQGGQDIRAFYLNPEVTYTVNKTLTVNPGVEIISGKDYTDASSDEYNSFSTLYGTGHKFTGHMDYFTNFPVHTKLAGLVTPYVRVIWKFSERTKFGLDYNYFALQNNYVRPGQTEPVDKALGSEVDLNCSINFPGDINLFFGYSIMLAQKSMEYITGGDSGKQGQWAFLMLTLKPTLFNSSR